MTLPAAINKHIAIIVPNHGDFSTSALRPSPTAFQLPVMWLSFRQALLVSRRILVLAAVASFERHSIPAYHYRLQNAYDTPPVLTFAVSAHLLPLRLVLDTVIVCTGRWSATSMSSTVAIRPALSASCFINPTISMLRSKQAACTRISSIHSYYSSWEISDDGSRNLNIVMTPG